MPSLPEIRNYQAQDPYNNIIDGRPIQDLETAISIVNAVVDNNQNAITDAIGTQGSLANRLNQSLNEDGSLKTIAIDNALHSIAEHLDTDAFVRMTIDERSKLSFIASGATNLKLQVETISTSFLFDAGTVNLKTSDSVNWRVDSLGVYADVSFPLTSRHRHYYDIKPANVNVITPDYQNFLTASTPVAYVEGSLTVYINGVKISHTDGDQAVRFPRISGLTVTWVPISYIEDTPTSGIVLSGKFTLSTAILATDRIRINFDIQLA